MSATATQRIGGGLLAAIALVAVLLVGSVIAYLTAGGRSSAASNTGVPRDALYGIALDADAAARGEEAGLSNLQKQVAQLKEAAAFFHPIYRGRETVGLTGGNGKL